MQRGPPKATKNTNPSANFLSRSFRIYAGHFFPARHISAQMWCTSKAKSKSKDPRPVDRIPGWSRFWSLGSSFSEKKKHLYKVIIQILCHICSISRVIYVCREYSFSRVFDQFYRFLWMSLNPQQLPHLAPHNLYSPWSSLAPSQAKRTGVSAEGFPQSESSTRWFKGVPFGGL